MYRQREQLIEVHYNKRVFDYIGQNTEAVRILLDSNQFSHCTTTTHRFTAVVSRWCLVPIYTLTDIQQQNTIDTFYVVSFASTFGCTAKTRERRRYTECYDITRTATSETTAATAATDFDILIYLFYPTSCTRSRNTHTHGGRVKNRTAADVGFQLVATHVRHLRVTEVIAAAAVVSTVVGAAAALIFTAVVWAASGAMRDHIYDVNNNNENWENDRPTDRLTDWLTDWLRLKRAHCRTTLNTITDDWTAGAHSTTGAGRDRGNAFPHFHTREAKTILQQLLLFNSETC